MSRISECTSNERSDVSSRILKSQQVQLRWDKACSDSYYYYTGQHLDPLVSVMDSLFVAYETGSMPGNSIYDVLDSVYSSIVSTLQTAANIFVPKCRKGFFKYWWDEELHVLKDAAIESNKIWINAGKPKRGPIFHRRQSCRSQYRKRLREKKDWRLKPILMISMRPLCKKIIQHFGSAGGRSLSIRINAVKLMVLSTLKLSQKNLLTIFGPPFLLIILTRRNR